MGKVLKFSEERDTKNKVVFSEEAEEGQDVVGTLYVQKSHVDEVASGPAGSRELEIEIRPRQ